MPRLQRKGFDLPDEVRQFENGRVDIIRLDEVAISRFVFQPGWCWSKHVASIAGTRSCQHRHLGYTISGSLEVRMDDGTQMTIGPGEAYEIPPGHDARVVGNEPWDSVEFTSGNSFAKTSETLDERILATILFSDIVNSTSTLERAGDTVWNDLLLRHNTIIRTVIDRFRGREIATLGDGFLALFDGAARAVQAGAAMERAVSALDLQIRIGIHTGEVTLVGRDARGVSVHAAARIAALASPSEVLVSGTTFDLLDGSGLVFDPRGEVELKGLNGSKRIYALRR
jgi:class 3 adenylate cyclase